MRMSQANQALKPSAIASIAVLVGEWVASRAAAMRHRHNAAATRRLLLDLPDEQLDDIGIERSAISDPEPIIEVDRATMHRLMSLS